MSLLTIRPQTKMRKALLHSTLLVAGSSLLHACGAARIDSPSLGDLTRETPKYTTPDETKEREQLSQEALRAEAIENYRAFIELIDDGPERREAMRRLADLLIAQGNDAALAPRSNNPFEQGPNDGRDNRDGPTTLYRNLLRENPDSPDNDRVLYQLARALLADGKPDEAIVALEDLAERYPDSSYVGEANLRRAELLFIKRQYAEAAGVYEAVLNEPRAEEHHQHARYKLGWSQFKLKRYARSLDILHPLLDEYLPAMVDQKLGESEIDLALKSLPKSKQRLISDALRVSNLCFAYAGEDLTPAAYLEDREPRRYEPILYASLARFYTEQERFADSAETWRAFEERNPTDAQAPLFGDQRIIAYEQGGFPDRALQARRDYVKRYNLQDSYWLGRNPTAWPNSVKRLKESIVTLAKHHHAAGQQEAMPWQRRQKDYAEAAVWYRAFLDSFPKDKQTTEMHFLLAESLNDSRQFEEAAKAFEEVAYNYPSHSRSAEAGYAAVLAWRSRVAASQPDSREGKARDAVAGTLRFADGFPSHPQTAKALLKATESLYELKDYSEAAAVGNRILKTQPGAAAETLRAAQILVAHSHFDAADYLAAEPAYQAALVRTPAGLTSSRRELSERLAASIYKQAEAHRDAEELDLAVTDFLRVAKVVPNSSIAPTADFDAAALLIQQENWTRAATELQRFRKQYPNHPLQDKVTDKLAAVYLASDQPGLAAAEFQRIGQRQSLPKPKREAALLQAAQLFEQAKQDSTAILAWQQYLQVLPDDREQAIEARQRLIDLYIAQNNFRSADFWRTELINAVRVSRKGASDRSKLLAANASLELAEKRWEAFERLPLKPPFERTLPQKRQALKAALNRYEQASSYGIAEINTQASYRTAEMYHHLYRALIGSERPSDLNELELEEYELLLEEQADPFAQQAMKIHTSNILRVFDDLYDRWLEASLEQLGELDAGKFGRRTLDSAPVTSYE